MRRERSFPFRFISWNKSYWIRTIFVGIEKRMILFKCSSALLVEWIQFKSLFDKSTLPILTITFTSSGLRNPSLHRTTTDLILHYWNNSNNSRSIVMLAIADILLFGQTKQVSPFDFSESMPFHRRRRRKKTHRYCIPMNRW